MAIIVDGKLTNTEEDNKFINAFLKTQSSITVKVKETGEFIKMRHLVMREDADYIWQIDCLQDRLEHPNKYETIEDVDTVIKQLQDWILEYEQNHFKSKLV